MTEIEEVTEQVHQLEHEMAEIAVAMVWAKDAEDLMTLMREAKGLDEERVELWHMLDHLDGSCTCDVPEPQVRPPPDRARPKAPQISQEAAGDPHQGTVVETKA